MAELKLLQFSDNHLGKTFAQMSDERNRQRQNDLKETFHKIIDLAIAKTVHAILIPGDIFHAKAPGLGLVEWVRQEFERFTQTGGEIFITPGNHDDWLSESTPAAKILTELPGVHVFTSPDISRRTCLIGDFPLHVYGRGYVKEQQHSSPLAGFQKADLAGIHLILIHGSCGAIALEHAQGYYPFSESELDQTGLDYAALGHFHSLAKCNTNFPAYYTGSPEGLRFHPQEAGPRHCLYIRFDDTRQAEITPIVINQREIRLDTADLSVDSVSGIVQKLRQSANEKTLLAMKLTGIVKMTTELVELAGLADQFASLFFHLQLDHQQVQCGEALLQKAIENSPEGMYLQVMQEYLQQAAPDEQKLWHEALLTGLAEMH